MMASAVPRGNQQEHERKRRALTPMESAFFMCARQEKFIYSDETLGPCHSGRILSGLYKQWIDGKFLDVTIKTGSECIKAHKCVLVALSNYFEALFDSNMSDANLEVLSLHCLDVVAVRLLINFAYVGSLEITLENAVDLLQASSYLGIESVIGACSRFLLWNISVENCIDMHEVAVRFGQLKMRIGVENFMTSHFGSLLKEDHFLKINIETLTALLDKDELIAMENNFSPSSQTEHETKLVYAVLQYVNADPVIRSKHLMPLLSGCIRLLLLPRETIESLKNHEMIASSPECQNLLNRILLSEMSNDDRERELWERPRYCSVEYRSTRILAYSYVSGSGTPEKFDDRALFSDGQCVYIVGMKLHTRLWKEHQVIGGMKILYNTGLSAHHGLNSNSTRTIHSAEFRLLPNERITLINIQAESMVHQLEFKTNVGNTYGPYGVDGGSKWSFLRPCDTGYLAFITGTVDVIKGAKSIRKIQFIWAFPKSMKSSW